MSQTLHGTCRLHLPGCTLSAGGKGEGYCECTFSEELRDSDTSMVNEAVFRFLGAAMSLGRIKGCVSLLHPPPREILLPSLKALQLFSFHHSVYNHCIQMGTETNKHKKQYSSGLHFCREASPVPYEVQFLPVFPECRPTPKLLKDVLLSFHSQRREQRAREVSSCPATGKQRVLGSVSRQQAFLQGLGSIPRGLSVPIFPHPTILLCPSNIGTALTPVISSTQTSSFVACTET